MKIITRFVTMCSLVSLGGCATLPDATVQYYPVKATLKLVTIETIACDSDKKKLVYAASTTATLTGVANHDAAAIPIAIKGPDNFGSDLDSTFTFTDDGRLKGVNVSTTGEGEEIAKSAISIATAALTMMAEGTPKPAPPAVSAQQCTILAALGDKGPPTLTFTGTVEFGTGKPIVMDMQGDDLAQLAISAVPSIPKPSVSFSQPKVLSPAAYGTVGSDQVGLQLQKLASVTVVVSLPSITPWSQDLTVPTNEPFTLPIPRGKLFGKQNFALSLSDVGAITSIQYGKTSGAAGALNTGGSVVSVISPSSVAARDNGAADEIAAQERLVKCKADPTKCPSK
ncbi:hypothetical protein [Telmatospirillum sp.]|uniref:hypothetical protein n=1 Tax=Telmatospirillum sp. TaxID=2079197 RepID=UPI00283B9460|nr:hypothetical protein [Telmatospirillum sp.]MDR3440000.1 hypothetical protein [Telmatospirillum sp.]